MSSALFQTLTLNRLQLSVENSVTDAQRQQLQQRVRNRLEQISVYPLIPPQVILVVRYLSDPEPGQLLASDHYRGRRSWEQAVQNTLNNCWRKAVRPARSPVPSTANSVWFADIAEWLACLSWDLYRKVERDRWWWKTTLGNQAHFSPGEKIFYHWQSEPQWLPATLTLLLTHRSTETCNILDWLTPEQSTRLLAAVGKEYNFSLSLTSQTSSRDEISFAIAALHYHLPPLIQHQIERWSPVTQLLVAVCLTLPHTAQFIEVEHSPLLPASPDLTKSQNDWESTESTSVVSSAATPVESPEDATESAAPIQVDAHPPRTKTAQTVIAKDTTPKIVRMQSKPLVSELPPVNPPQNSPILSSETSVAATELSTYSAELPSEPFLLQNPPQNSPIPFSETSVTATELSTDSAHLPSEPLIQKPPLVIAPEPEQGVATAVGGLWYLVNVLAMLDWPELDLNLTPWHQLSALAQAVLPEMPPDPVWRLLADLAGEPITPKNLARWQALALTQVQTYLSDRLEHPQEIANYLLEPATLYLTRTHVDLVFTLEQIRLDLRLAGLDRDPGWVPELARVITFHYE